MPLCEVQENIPAMFRRAAINAALGSARSFYSHLARWQKSKEKAEAKGKKCKDRPPVPPRSWNKIRNYDNSLAHLVSARIVQFAQEHEASILVFEHLVISNLRFEVSSSPSCSILRWKSQASSCQLTWRKRSSRCMRQIQRWTRPQMRAAAPIKR